MSTPPERPVHRRPAHFATGDEVVIAVRLDALRDAIDVRDWEQVMFQYDRVRSSVERALGTRERPYDQAALDALPPLPAERARRLYTRIITMIAEHEYGELTDEQRESIRVKVEQLVAAEERPEA